MPGLTFPHIIAPHYYGAQRPQWPFIINRDSLQFSGAGYTLVALWPFGPPSIGTTAVELIGGDYGTLTNLDPPNDWASDVELGSVLDLSSDTNGMVQAGGTAISGLTQISLIYWVEPIGAHGGDFGYHFLLGPIADIEILILQHDSSPDNEKLDFRREWSTNEGEWKSASDGFFSDNVRTLVGISYDGNSTGNNPIFYKDGVDNGAPTETSTPIGSLQSTGTVQIDFGNRRSDAGRNYNGRMSFFRIYDGVVPASVMRQAFNPLTRWDLYYPLSHRVFVNAPPVGGLSIPVAMHEYRQRHQSVA